MRDEFEPFFDAETTELVELELESVEQTRKVGAVIGKALTEGFIGLVGDLGAGKTTLIKGVVEYLNDDIYARSPTYTLLNEYETVPKIIHVDLYRLADIDELATIGYWDYVDASGAIVCVEWLDRIPGAWPGEGSVMVFEEWNDIRHLFARSSSNELVEALRQL